MPQEREFYGENRREDFVATLEGGGRGRHVRGDETWGKSDIGRQSPAVLAEQRVSGNASRVEAAE